MRGRLDGEVALTIEAVPWISKAIARRFAVIDKFVAKGAKIPIDGLSHALNNNGVQAIQMLI